VFTIDVLQKFIWFRLSEDKGENIMDGITLSVLGSLVASQFFIYYRLGRIEERLKNIENNTRIR